MTTDHVHARPLERSAAQAILAREERSNKRFDEASSRTRRVAITLLYALLLALTAWLAWFLKAGVITLVGMFLLLVAHEWGHYRMMMKLGVEVEEVGIGIPYGIFRHMQREVAAGKFPFKIQLSLVWVAFYVDEGKSGKAALERLSYKDRVKVFAAGPTVNLVLALLLLTTLPLHAWLSGAFTPTPTSILYVLGGVAAVLWIDKSFFRDIPHLFSMAMGVGVVAFLIWLTAGAFATDFSEALSNGGTLAGEPRAVLGPVTIIKMMAQGQDPFGGAIGNNPLLIMHGFLAVLSFGLAATNFLPVLWFDGGQIWGAVFDEWFGAKASRVILKITTTLIFAPLLAIIMMSEFSGWFRVVAVSSLLLLIVAAIVDRRLKTVKECVRTCAT